jgi:hypothetical protein
VITAADVPFDPKLIDWQTYLPADEQDAVRDMLPSYMGDTDWQIVIAMTKDRLSELFDLVYGVSQQELAVGYKEENSNEVISRIILNISEQSDLSAQESRLLTQNIQNDLKANIVFDQEATRIKQDDAAAAVQPVTYMKGQNIVMKGEVVTPGQYSVLDRMELLDQPDSTLEYSLSAILYIALLFVVYIVYILNFEKKLSAFHGVLSPIPRFITLWHAHGVQSAKAPIISPEARSFSGRQGYGNAGAAPFVRPWFRY